MIHGDQYRRVDFSYGENTMTVAELMEILLEQDPCMEVMIEARDSTGKYCDAYEMTEKHVYIGDEHIVIVAE